MYIHIYINKKFFFLYSTHPQQRNFPRTATNCFASLFNECIDTTFFKFSGISFIIVRTKNKIIDFEKILLLALVLIESLDF